MKSVYTPNDFLRCESDSAMIQAAVDEAAKYGVTVEIPRYNARTESCIWELDESIRLHTGSHVILDNCHLRLKDDCCISFFINSGSVGWREGVYSADRQYDISLTGRGNALLDGGTPLDFCEGDFNIYDENGNFVRSQWVHGIPSMTENIALRFVNVERITVSNLRFIHNRYWTMSFWFCAFGTVRDISVEAMNNVPNQDGINIRHGCHNFLVENIDALTGDDTVALTALEAKRFAGKSDLCGDIHDIIVRNVRSRQTGECDIVRILARGGTQIYNVLLDGLFDLTDAGEAFRPLAAVRIGDLCDYPLRLNVLGETRNIVVRNVFTRARFGAYIANTLSDSSFDTIRLYGDAGIGMYFNGCELENVTVRGLCYDVTAKAPDTDIGYSEVFHRVKIHELNAVHFENCRAKHLVFDGVTAGKNLSHVFGGNSDLELNARDVVTMDENTKLTDCVRVHP